MNTPANYVVPPHGSHADFPVIRQGGYDFTGMDKPSPIQMDVKQLSRFEGTGQVSNGPISTNDELFTRLHEFEKSLRDNVFEVDCFYGELFDATWREYIEARHKAVNYRCKLGVIPHESVPSLYQIWQNSETRQRYYLRLVPNYDHTSLMFADATLEDVRDMFFEGHGAFFDDIHKAYFVAMFKKVFQVARLTDVDPLTFKPSYGACTYEIYGALPPMELGTEHSAPAHAYMQLTPLSRLELYQPHHCDLCDVRCIHMVSEVNCTEHCRFIALEHAKALQKPAVYGRYLPNLQRPHMYCKSCFDQFCNLGGGMAHCALCGENEVVGDSAREVVDWQFGVNRGWVENRYTTITGEPTPPARRAVTAPSSGSSDEDRDKSDDVNPIVKRFRKCFCCDMKHDFPWCAPPDY